MAATGPFPRIKQADLARLLAAHFPEALGQQASVEGKPGARPAPVVALQFYALLREKCGLSDPLFDAAALPALPADTADSPTSRQPTALALEHDQRAQIAESRPIRRDLADAQTRGR